MPEMKYEPFVMRESCPYCGEMTDMVEVLTRNEKKQVVLRKYVSGTCKCGKKIDPLTLGVPELVDAKTDLKADPEVLP